MKLMCLLLNIRFKKSSQALMLSHKMERHECSKKGWICNLMNLHKVEGVCQFQVRGEILLSDLIDAMFM